MSNLISKKRMTSNFLLFTCVIILMLIIHFNPLTPPNTNKTLSELKKSDITKILIHTPNQQQVLLKLNNQRWSITQPISVFANQARVDNILNLVSNKKFTRFSNEEINLKEFGLDHPLATLSLNDTEFMFGDTDPIDNQRYVLTNKTLYLIEDIIFPIITANLGGLIDSKLIQQADRVTEIQLPHFSIKNNQGQWQTQDKITDQQSLHDWVKLWKQAHAVYLNTSNLTTDGKTKIRIYLGDEKLEFFVFNEAERTGLYRDDLNLMYHLDPAILLKLLSTPNNDA